MPKYFVINDACDFYGAYKDLPAAVRMAEGEVDRVREYGSDASQPIVEIVEVVRRWKRQDFTHADGSPGHDFALDESVRTEADQLRAELAECKEWLARFCNDSDAYQMGVEAERQRILELIAVIPRAKSSKRQRLLARLKFQINRGCDGTQ